MKKLNKLIEFLNEMDVETLPWFEVDKPANIISIPINILSLDSNEIKNLIKKFNYLQIVEWNLEHSSEGLVISILKKYLHD